MLQTKLQLTEENVGRIMAEHLIGEARMPNKLQIIAIFNASEQAVRKVFRNMTKKGLIRKMRGRDRYAVTDREWMGKLIAEAFGVHTEPKLRRRSKAYDRLLGSVLGSH